jgi:hypothetical protein
LFLYTKTVFLSTYSPMTSNSHSCFLVTADVTTDQGPIPIQNIQPTYHTLGGKRILCVTQTIVLEPVLVQLPVGSLALDVPEKTITLTREQRVRIPGSDEFVSALSLVGTGTGTGVTTIPYRGETLYNVLLETPSSMCVYGLEVETLHPDNHHSVLSRSRLLKQTNNNKTQKQETQKQETKEEDKTSLLAVINDAYVQRIEQHIRSQRLLQNSSAPASTTTPI